MTPSLLELCDHARRSCMVNGLIPKEWRWGKDAMAIFFHPQAPPSGIDYAFHFQGMLVSPMEDPNQTGVACIGKKPYVSLLEGKDCSGAAKIACGLPIPPPYTKKEEA